MTRWTRLRAALGLVNNSIFRFGGADDADRQATRQVVDAAADTSARRYQRRSETLRDKIIEVLRGWNAPLAVGDIVQAVIAVVCESANQNFAQQVAMTLSKMEELERVACGTYQLKAT